jgi:hypothetical protein
MKIPQNVAYFIAFPMGMTPGNQLRPRGSIHGDGFKNILEEFSQWLIVSSLMEGHAKYSISPINDDKLDLVIPADPKPLYNPMSKTFSIR